MIITPNQAKRSEFHEKIILGRIFIYPTDTIYGIGCDATNDKSVERIREIKHRPDAPFSVAVPSKKWILDNCEVNAEVKKWLNKLPGPYTLLLKLKNPKALSKQVFPNTDLVGIRMPDNWFAQIVKELNLPIVSTSANITQEKHMVSIDDLNPEVANKVDFIIDDGPLSGTPSTIVDFSNKEPKIMKR